MAGDLDDPSTAIAHALGGLAGAPPTPGRLYVVAVPRFSPEVTSVRAAVVLAGADVIRVPVELPPDVLAPLVGGEVIAGTLAAADPATILADAADRVVVQLIATAVQTSPAVWAEVARLRAAGVEVEVVGSAGEVEAALVASGVGAGVARTAEDGRLDTAVLAADRPDLAAWRAGLTRRGYLDHTPVVLLDRAGTPQQRSATMTVKDLPDAEVAGLVVCLVGDAVTGPEGWRADLPLRGRVIANLRAPHQAAALTARLRSLGASVVHLPLLEIAPGDADAMASVLAGLGSYDVLALTSTNGVDALADAIEATGLDARVLAAAGRIACVGPGTAAALRSRLNVAADVIAEVHTGEGLADTLGAPPHREARAVLLRGDLAAEVLHDRLVEAGWGVTDVVAYRTQPRTLGPQATALLASGQIDAVAVLSSSMARGLVAAGREHGVRARIVSIGPITTQTLAEHGVMPAAEADPHTLDGLVAAIVEACRPV